MDPQQQERFREAVDRKAEEAEERSHQGAQHSRAGDVDPRSQAEGLSSTGYPQDEHSVRDKNAGKGKKTADKWNQ